MKFVPSNLMASASVSNNGVVTVAQAGGAGSVSVGGTGVMLTGAGTPADDASLCSTISSASYFLSNLTTIKINMSI